MLCKLLMLLCYSQMLLLQLLLVLKAVRLLVVLVLRLAAHVAIHCASAGRGSVRLAMVYGLGWINAVRAARRVSRVKLLLLLMVPANTGQQCTFALAKLGRHANCQRRPLVLAQVAHG